MKRFGTSFRTLVGTTQAKFGRRFSSHIPKFEEPPIEKKSFFSRAGKFAYDNRQGFLNIFVVYLAFAMSISNYRSSGEKKSMEEEVKAIREEKEYLRESISRFQSSEFIEKAVDAVGKEPNLEKKRAALKSIVESIVSIPKDSSSSAQDANVSPTSTSVVDKKLKVI